MLEERWGMTMATNQEYNPAGHLPCQSCGRYADEWHEDADGIRWTITAPYGVKVEPGQPWTCKLCEDSETAPPPEPEGAIDEPLAEPEPEPALI